jgi:exonuclease III
LIQNVFKELHAKAPDDIRYLALKLADGSFVHLVTVNDGSGDNPLPKLEAFRKFQADLKERLVEQPQVNEAAIVGDYRMLGA